MEDLTDTLMGALEKARAADTKGALAALKAVIASPDFPELSEELRYYAYMLGAFAADELGEDKLALSWSRKVTAMPQASATDWHTRLSAAWGAPDVEDAILTLTTIARRWPLTLSEVRDDSVVELLREAEKRDDEEAHFQLLDALYEGRWQPNDTFADYDTYWRQLSLALLERGHLQRARAAGERVSSAYDIVMMRADKRFDPVTSADPEHYDIDKTIARELETYRQRARARPDDLNGYNAVALLLLHRNRLDEALALVDEALARALPADGSASRLAGVDKVNWTLDFRARVLRGLGREEEALKAFERGSMRPERGGFNVSQRLNRGSEFARMGRGREALDAIADVQRRDVSDYGWMVAQSVRACGHAQLGEKAAAEAALAYLREHKADGPGPYRLALLCAGDVDGLAAFWIEGLEDPGERQTALAQVQDYAWPEGPGAFRQELARRRALVLARADVQAAIDKVGRVLKVPLMEP